MASELEQQLAGFSLTTAEIFYRLPDHQSILQSYIWQDWDLAPEFPALEHFLEFWRDELEGPLHSVTVMCRNFISPGICQPVSYEFRH